MKRDLKLLIEDIGRKAKARRQSGHEHQPDYGHLSSHLRKHHHVNLRASSLKKLWELVTGKRKLSPAAKDRLALFAGFQSWKDLDNALHGDVDASVNYEQS